METTSVQISFLSEIQSIMYAMGDCQRPLAESAKLIEETVLHEMRQFVCKGQEIAEQRDLDWLTVEDLIFLLRNDKPILQRVINALKTMDLKTTLRLTTSISGKSDTEDIVDSFVENVSDCSTLRPAATKRMKMCEDILDKLDPTGDLLSLLDDSNYNDDSVKFERKMRRATYASSMDAGEYMRYAEARQVTLLTKVQNGRKFRDWVFGPDATDENGSKELIFDGFKPVPVILEILSVISSEIIATLMDCAFIIRRECDLNSLTNGQSSEVVRLRPQTAGSTGVSELMSPSSVSSAQKFPRNSQHVALLLAQQAKLKPSNLLQRQSVSTEEPSVINNNEYANRAAVQPWEIREAIRRLRYYNGGPSVFFIFGCNNFAKLN